MDIAAVEPQSFPQFQSPSFSPSSEESCRSLIQESIHHLLVQLRAGASDFSHFNLIFSRLLQTIPSPPVEIIWFYAAVNFHAHKAAIGHHNPRARISALKDLFQLLVSCSDSCCSLKRIGVLAPLAFELYNLVTDFKIHKSSSFDEEIYGEIDCFLDRLVSYISLCCVSGGYVHDNSPALSCCFVDLAQVWTFNRCQRGLEHPDYFQVLFPAVSGEVHSRLKEGCGVGYLAGVVMLEFLTLRLCLKHGSPGPENKSLEAVMRLAGDIITGFRSCYFYDILLEMLLESTITFPLSCDEALLQMVLYNAIMNFDYPFSHSGSGMQPCNNHLKGLALSWLFVAGNALSFMRKNFGESQADGYAKGFFISLSRSRLMGWLTSTLRMEESTFQQISSSPAALFDWISKLHFQVSDPDISKLAAKVANKKDFDNSCTIDHAPTEMAEAVPRSSFCSEANDCGRKRKGTTDGSETGLQLKMLKYQSSDDSYSGSLFFHNGDGLLRQKENESAAPDEDMEIMVQ